MTIATWADRHQHLALFADAYVMTAGAFAAVLGVPVVIMGPTLSGPEWLSAGIGLLSMLTIVVGPLAAWLLNSRQLTWVAVLGAIGGSVAIGIVVPSLALIGAGLGWVLSPLSASELTGPIAMLGLVSLGFIFVVAIVVGRAWQGLHVHPLARLTIARVVSVLVLAAFGLGSIWFAMTSTNAERGEPMIFVMAWGLAGAMLTLGADLATSWHQRRAGPRTRSHQR